MLPASVLCSPRSVAFPRAHATARTRIAAPQRSLQPDDRVFIRDGDACWFVSVRSIVMLEGDGNQTRIVFHEGRPLLCRNIGALEGRLPSSLFLRANRSQVINLSYVESIRPWFGSTLKVTLTGNLEVELSRRQTQLFRHRFCL